ncbi:hypothetical protein A5731_00330 [Mycolicibacterium conceptionense]|uniref:hypothetical protein n=1 Tax=Mycolicibacterium conceptionense TaxID=451644 RepID=UPI0007E9EAC5|nr:hypothetical protein [Mycolicibacterium conceptionense]OBB15450.1 hypothetical protein A5718_29720 [Mycolicibacterium conceptionense]OBF09192.1 hypothetical protein A5731_00330 [Mycolicibacterium conceptionense]
MSVFDSGPVLLDKPETMLKVLTELVADDATSWRGVIDVWDTGDGAVWRVELNDDKSNQVRAVQGQYVVLTYGRLLVLDADEV